MNGLTPIRPDALRRRLPLLLLAIVLLVMPVAAQNPSRPLPARIIDFSWPLPTGTVVPAGATAVVLDGGMGFERRFRLPEDCGALDDAVRTFGDDGTDAFRAQLASAREFCARARVFTLGSATASRNFMARVDFTSLSLDQIPYDLRCRGVASEAFADLCQRLGSRDATVCSTGTLPDALSYAGFIARTSATGGGQATLDCRPLRVDPVSCRLTRSVFTGTIALASGLVRCNPRLGTADAVGIRLTDVTFRDVDRDGVMDAILTVEEDGGRPGTAAEPAWFSFALTKRSPSAALARVPLD